MRRAIPIVTGAVVLAVIVVAVILLTGGSSKTLTAYFPQAIGVYKGSSVRILGVPVGTVTAVTPEGTRVRVDMQYGGDYRLPVDVAAVIVPPSIVSDRYVQLAPVYRGGPVAPDHTFIPENRTEVPVELDDIFRSVNTLNVALGPKGANANGALSRLIDTGAANLDGNGQQLHDTLRALSDAVATLGDNRGDLFQTVTNLQKFTTALAQDDGGVRRFNNDLSSVAVQLNGERQELAQALANLSTALQQVASFVHDNKNAVTTDVRQLASITNHLVAQRRGLAEILDDGAIGLGDLALSYDPQSQTLRNRNNMSTSDLVGLICGALQSSAGSLPVLGQALQQNPGVTTLCQKAESGKLPINLPIGTSATSDHVPADQTLSSLLGAGR